MNKKERLLELIKEKALRVEPVILSSGKKSDYYIDCRLITMDAEGAYLIARIFLDMLKDRDVDALGGLTMGADPITGAFAAVSFQEGRAMNGFIVRKKAKEHGTKRAIEGPLSPGSKVVVVDDVATTGGSLIQAAKEVEAYGCEVVAAYVVVDRLEGAKEALKDAGYELYSIFTRDDLLAK